MTTLFLLAHQDDEIGVLYDISETRARGEQCQVVFLTNGAFAGVAPERRNAESLVVLTKLGVRPGDIHYLGTDLAIEDGRLVENLEACRDALIDLASRVGPVDRIIMHAWEGGHHDHDAGHLAGLAVARHLGLLDKGKQFPLYRMPAGWKWLSFAAPLAANGAVSAVRIPPAERLHHLMLLRHYRSQWRVMLELAPHLAWSYLFDGRQKLQRVTLERVSEKPYPGELLYERWRLYSWDAFAQRARPFVERHLAPGAGCAAEHAHD